MGVMDWLFGRKPEAPRVLVGCWHLLPQQGGTAEPAEADFRADGRLYYSVLSGARWQIMKLRYRVEGDVIITDQPTAPSEERSRYSVDLEGVLTLELNGERSRFQRGAKRAPKV